MPQAEEAAQPSIGQLIERSIETYVAAWNEHDQEKRARLIEQCCAPDLRIVAPQQEVHGHKELDALIVDFHRRRPGDRGRLSTAIESHGRIFRFAAMIEGSTVAPPIEMLDAGECDETGRIRLILTFVGATPPSR
jgi:hypothetical protein